MTRDVQGVEKQIKYKWTGLTSFLNRIFSASRIFYDDRNTDGLFDS